MEPEILKLKAEFIHQQVEVAEHISKMQDIVNKAVNMFKEDKNITFEDFKDARNLMDRESGFELAALERMNMLNIKELIIENMFRNFISNKSSFMT